MRFFLRLLGYKPAGATLVVAADGESTGSGVRSQRACGTGPNPATEAPSAATLPFDFAPAVERLIA